MSLILFISGGRTIELQPDIVRFVHPLEDILNFAMAEDSYQEVSYLDETMMSHYYTKDYQKLYLSCRST